MSSGYKNCPKCKSKNVLKNGFQYNRQRYKCKDCKKQFQSNLQPKRNNNSIINQLTFKKSVLILNMI